MPSGRIVIDLTDDKPSMRDRRFPFTGAEVSDASRARYEYVTRKMGEARAVFLEEVAKNPPNGITINPLLIDIDSVETQNYGTTSSMTYAQNVQLPMSEKCSTALADYNRYKAERRIYWRQTHLYERMTDQQIWLNDSEVADLRIFEPS